MKKLPSAATLTPDQLVERWTVWMKETERDAFHLYSSRFLFENIHGMFRSNPRLHSDGGAHLYDWLHRNFYTEYLISIRREMEKGGGFMTLANFLLELEKHCESVLVRARYVALNPNDLIREFGLADEHFSDKFGAMCRYPKTSAHEDCISSASTAAQ
jgi:hypothetical protein